MSYHSEPIVYRDKKDQIDYEMTEDPANASDGMLTKTSWARPASFIVIGPFENQNAAPQLLDGVRILVSAYNAQVFDKPKKEE